VERMVYINLPQSDRRMEISIQRLMQILVHLPSHTLPPPYFFDKLIMRPVTSLGRIKTSYYRYLTVGMVTAGWSELIPSQKFVTTRDLNGVQSY
jgi:hypothetical protein